MAEPESKTKRPRNAQRARETILDAAEAVFAQNGFDGARIDAIAKASGYNPSLLFQYFTDKLGLYEAMLRRADRELNALLAGAVAPWASGEKNLLEPQKFSEFLKAIVRTMFDYSVEHRRFVRVLTWEMAEGWSTYIKIATQFTPGQPERLGALLRSASEAGLLRSDFYPMIQILVVMHMYLPFLASLPLYQMILPGEDISSLSNLARAREYLVDFVIGGTMINPPEGQELLTVTKGESHEYKKPTKNHLIDPAEPGGGRDYSYPLQGPGENR